jgi:hypothetical protein
LRAYWVYHPKYKDVVDHIQGKYSFRERPSYGIIVKTGGGSKFDLSADNFVGTVHSYVYLTKVQNYPGVAIEWVREDARAIQNNKGIFPSPAGVYYIELTEDDEFYVDPLLTVAHEPITVVDTFTAQLQHAPLAGSVRLYEMPAGFMLYEGTNYTLTLNSEGKPTGEIVFKQAIPTGRFIIADYKYPIASSGPYKIIQKHANNQAIPGCVLAFGGRLGKGDRLAVVVSAIREPAALEYGGRWDLSLDFDVISRDLYAQQDISDQTIIYINGVLRSYLSNEGIEIMDLSLGGESEEVYDETADDYFYNASFSVSVQTEWSIHVPLHGYFRQVAPLTLQQAELISTMSDAEAAKVNNNLVMLQDLGLEAIVDPFFKNRDENYEMIK